MFLSPLPVFLLSTPSSPRVCTARARMYAHTRSCEKHFKCGSSWGGVWHRIVALPFEETQPAVPIVMVTGLAPRAGLRPEAFSSSSHSPPCTCLTAKEGPSEYKIGQLYMISKHSHEQSDRGEGVEVVQNEPFEDPHHGNGQFTEKRVYLNSKLPSWARAVVPKIFYVTEKAWNYYPYTITGKSCSFLPKFSIHIETKYEDNKGSNDRVQWRFICFQTTGDRG
ncbi:uncharacterized protein LOC131498192 isoform X1 [Neofelis nebulosa]|uniref:uncharacterized protein LOC131497273 isoform X1 n=2 Tax=Neofelis nebulosa TaxID=61452 RepID=UPI00272C4BB6|nr:uncharacterized protein LOC131497273 isoform X1 [Neofelis nebulosa]XP_058559439.1 uncharacterized protein LOC131497274 isoform X1 [Neofelis nebulosa]XP_058559443.1 uncharacterized protein LOC131497275 isoform X1 [Neofelis nebulosa]XP_058561188.1 uncharacterized protein LOC131498192 isoform X1 [Neofelis nebulosa]